MYVRLENTFLGAAGIGHTTERRLWSRGITDWASFHPDALGPKRGPKLADHIADARHHLADADAGYFLERLPAQSTWRLYEDFRDAACFFDIETTGLDEHRHDVTTVSFHHQGTTTTLVKDRDLTVDRLRTHLTSAPLLVTYNGGRFDIPFLETAYDIDITTPHLDAMTVCHRADLYGGLSGAESALGIDRELPAIDGHEAVRLWREAERGDDDALETLIQYNREDTTNLKRLLDAVTDRLHDDVFIE